MMELCGFASWRRTLLWIAVFLVVQLWSISAATQPKSCGPNFKEKDGDCVPVTDEDVIRGMHWLAHPPKSKCQRLTTVQDLAVCEDDLPQECVVWSAISSDWCVHYGSLEFELFWARRGCKVTLFHFVSTFKGNNCDLPAGPMKDQPNLTIVRNDLWGGRCFACLYKVLQPLFVNTPRVDVLKIQGREGVEEDLEGVQYTMLADIFLHLREELTQKVQQIVFHAAINARTLVDSVGRESEHAWNMFATQQLLSGYECVYLMPGQGPYKQLPTQFEHLLKQAELDPIFGIYTTSYRRIADPAQRAAHQQLLQAYKPQKAEKLIAKPPAYCEVPNEAAREAMQRWIEREVQVRCHATRLAVPCDRTRQHSAFIPCQQELMDKMAEDYANQHAWCDFAHPKAGIEPLRRVDPAASLAFQQPPLPRQEKVRLAFFFTVYTDIDFVRRLLDRLYSTDHYYLLHVDPAGSSIEFVRDVQALCDSYHKPSVRKHNNVFMTRDVPIVYGASTATMLLTRAMAWFLHHASNWDYFVPLTGSDYPLLPLHRIEKIFTYQQPPRPFVMAWTPGTSTHLFRLQKTHPVFETHPKLVRSIEAVTAERGKVLGAVPMEYRSGNFGPPLFCSNRSSFYHLDIRFNKTASKGILDTQWLFPRDVFPGRGRAYAEENPAHATLPPDKGWRIWKKSDPATTGAYDKRSVAYIVDSIEGRKYWHFFKHMLLGSEEHYYVSLLYNWPRTRAFVQTLSAQIVWNTWELGIWEQAGGFQTHTHFLTLNEWDILEGFSLRGMMFARKFSSRKTGALLDRIDSQLLQNASSQAGLFWPGFYEVDTYASGKYWVAAYRKNASARAMARKSGQDMLPMGLFVANVSQSPTASVSSSSVSSPSASSPESQFVNINKGVSGTSTRRRRKKTSQLN